MKNTASIEIDRPIEEVFKVTTERMPEWSKTVVEEKVIEETLEGVGTKFHMVTEERGRRMDFQGVVTRFDPPRESAARMVGKAFNIESAFTFEDLGGRTRVNQTASVTGNGLFKPMMMILGLVMGRAGCKAAEEELVCLKQYCEGQHG